MQKTVVVNMVTANAVSLQEIQRHVIEVQVVFQGVGSISVSTIDLIFHCTETLTVIFIRKKHFQYVQGQ